MANLIVEKNGFYQCDGKGKCGGTHFHNKESIKYSFNCDSCSSYIKNGLKISDNRVTLDKWFDI